MEGHLEEFIQPLFIDKKNKNFQAKLLSKVFSLSFICNELAK